MAALVLDTHTVLWYLAADPRLSTAARNSLLAASGSGDAMILPSICLVETIYLVEKGKVPVMAWKRLASALDDPDTCFQVAPLDQAVAVAVQRVPRDVVPDLPDRIIAATALTLGLPLVTRDRRLQSAGLATLW